MGIQVLTQPFTYYERISTSSKCFASVLTGKTFWIARICDFNFTLTISHWNGISKLFGFEFISQKNMTHSSNTKTCYFVHGGFRREKNDQKMIWTWPHSLKFNILSGYNEYLRTSYRIGKKIHVNISFKA